MMDVLFYSLLFAGGLLVTITGLITAGFVHAVLFADTGDDDD